jgi:serine/threonine protein kinase
MGRTEFNPLQPGTLVQGRYLVEKSLGIGSMAVVYRCLDNNLRKRQVAMKVLFNRVDEETKARFYKEIMYSYEIVHPNVVRTYELIDEPDLTAITLEYVDGGDLADLIFNQKQNHMSLNAAVDILAQLLRGVHAIHAAGIIHRDLKPENVLVTRAGVCKIADFSVAWTKNATKLTSHGGVIGSFSYISPEYLDHGQLDHRADIYALGVIAYEILTGSLPHKGDNLMQLASRAKDQIAPPSEVRPDCPVELSNIVMRALAADPELRYQTVSDMYADLDRFSTETGLGKEFSSELADVIEKISPRGNPTLRPTEVVKNYVARSYMRIGALAAVIAMAMIGILSFSSSDVRATAPTALKPPLDNLARAGAPSGSPQLASASSPSALHSDAAAMLSTTPGLAVITPAVSVNSSTIQTGPISEGGLAKIDKPAENKAADKAGERGQDRSGDKPADNPAIVAKIDTAPKNQTKEVTGSKEGPKSATKEAVKETTRSELQKIDSVKSDPAKTALPVETAKNEPAPMQVASLNSGMTSGDDQYSEMEYKVKAAMLFKFLSSVEWPDSSAQSESKGKSICIIGYDPFGGALEQILAQAGAAGSVSVRRFPAGTGSSLAGSCNIAYVNGQQRGNTNEIVESLEEQHVLTVTERLSSGIIHFYIHRGQVRFDVNSKEARSADIRVAHALMRLTEGS